MTDEQKDTQRVFSAPQASTHWLTDTPADIQRTEHAKRESLVGRLLQTLIREHWAEETSGGSYHRLLRIDPEAIRRIGFGLDEAKILLAQVPLTTLSKIQGIIVPDPALNEALGEAFDALVPHASVLIFPIDPHRDAPGGISGMNLLYVSLYRETGVTLFCFADQVRHAGGKILAAGVLLDCSPIGHLPPKTHAVATRPIDRYQKRDCPICKQLRLPRKKA